ncbi:SRPBCC family protein [Pinibacter aurantiacus]|nr:SRPBCC domain-containing protein [Pinibacter aurantiacus]
MITLFNILYLITSFPTILLGTTNQHYMNNKNFSVSIEVNQSPNEVFNAVNAVTKWWTENLKGSSSKLNDEFTVQFEDVHYSKQKLIEVVPDKKVVWLVTESKLSFVHDKQEWTNTQIIFEISKHGDKTQLLFTHVGLMPGAECYKDCSNAWGMYINGSLYNLITTGKGQPEKKEAEKQTQH